ncbi:MAG: pyridoxamine 5'-phosphate oxidase family protein [Anaerolineales bacterium]|nr:pyridoxamine 5'-phosphate oxidase family protein [Anaerolineales bacterium]MCB8950984.1 pyridoxamine 5'-phosphate oxidase family protein [Ardenticatenales bacterium]
MPSPPTRRNLDRWRAIEARLGREATIWLATVRRDGRPHLAPVWFVWYDEKIYLATSSFSQKYTNLRYNQNVTLSLADPYNVVLIEGEAHAANRHTTEKVSEHFLHKYEWDFRSDDSDDWRLVEITPHKVLAWGDGYDDEGIHIL